MFEAGGVGLATGWIITCNEGSTRAVLECGSKRSVQALFFIRTDLSDPHLVKRLKESARFELLWSDLLFCLLPYPIRRQKL
jgi:hypothetical protein